MRWLLFLSRVAFICGFFFLLSVSLLVKDWVNDYAITSTIITIGYAMGFVVVPIVNLCYLVVLIVKKRLVAYVPAWLITANVFYLIILIIYIFYLNDPYYHQR